MSLYPLNIAILLALSISTTLLLRLHRPTNASNRIDRGGSLDIQPPIQVPLNHSNSRVRNSEHLTRLVSQNHTLFKRELSEHYQCLVRKATVYLEKGIVPAVGHIELNKDIGGPTPEWTKAELKSSGWRRTQYTGKLFDSVWTEAFQMMPHKFPEKKEVTQVEVRQSSDFKNQHGKQKATHAKYTMDIVPGSGAIITTYCESPMHKVTIRYMFDKTSITKLLPPMHRFSDFLWYNWDTVVPAKPESLRYYAVQNIEPGSETSGLIDSILLARRRTYDVPWPKRVTFDISSDEGLVLWASPHGLALNWLWIHHGTVFGKRRPYVTIFNPSGMFGRNRCMIWDLMPEGGKSTFGEEEPPEYCNSVPPPAYCTTAGAPGWLGWLPEPATS
ncbi:MAG: hypothetical protein Q9209_005766 [Squamulea sp. 1 TL-2023]